MKSWTTVLAVCLTMVVIVGEVKGQVPIPRHKPGFVYGWGRPTNNASVYLDVYICLLCSDSRRAWPTVLQVAQWYGPDVLQLTTHLFPLPYHRFAFYTAKFTYVIEELSAAGNLSDCGFNKTYEWFDKVFANMATLTNSATRNMSDAEVVQRLAGLVNEVIPEVSKEDLLELVDSRTVELDTRAAWKYACTRGVAEVPAYKVNDIAVAVTREWTLTEWRTVLDPLLASQRTYVCGPQRPNITCQLECNAASWCHMASWLWLVVAVIVSTFL